ncbi:peptide chain release factor N(5)-glutamine methyltransferase [Fodinicurvata halophila]|uniref:peptide chain release factor N(5)-glutamine methyltransferase n=1 Tax=Fodinicurvata halophila TaxID=1419723 RepID=UPI003642A108
MTRVGRLLDEAARRLRESGFASPRREARLLLAGVLEVPSGKLLAYPEQEVAPRGENDFGAALERRLQGEPLSRILGRREFWSLEFEITPAVLDPRPDSETLIQGLLARLSEREGEWSVLDLGTGSGCLLLAMLHELPQARGIGTDCSEEALLVARRNATRLGLDARCRFLCADWGAALQGPFDIVLCNPYIGEVERAGLPVEVAMHDPATALFAGPDGLAAYRSLSGQLPDLVGKNGIAAVEIGAAQAEAVARLFRQAGAGSVEVLRDIAGHPRCLLLSGFPQCAAN